MSDHAEPDDDVELGVTQRRVSAADGSPLHTAAASTVFNWRGLGEAPATEEPAAAGAEAPTTPPTNPEEEPTMATTKKKRNGAARARNSTRGSPQLEICTALLQHGDLSREAIAQTLPYLTPSQISSALNNAKAHGRVALIEKDQVFRLTKEGKAWVEAAAGGEALQTEEVKPKRKAAGARSAHRRGRRAKPAQEVDTSPPADHVEPTFRCAVISDGGFWLAKDDVEIALTPAEHKQMLHYLERMAEPEAA